MSTLSDQANEALAALSTALAGLITAEKDYQARIAALELQLHPAVTQPSTPVVSVATDNTSLVISWSGTADSVAVADRVSRSLFIPEKGAGSITIPDRRPGYEYWVSCLLGTFQTDKVHVQMPPPPAIPISVIDPAIKPPPVNGVVLTDSGQLQTIPALTAAGKPVIIKNMTLSAQNLAYINFLGGGEFYIVDNIFNGPFPNGWNKVAIILGNNATGTIAFNRFTNVTGGECIGAYLTHDVAVVGNDFVNCYEPMHWFPIVNNPVPWRNLLFSRNKSAGTLRYHLEVQDGARDANSLVVDSNVFGPFGTTPLPNNSRLPGFSMSIATWGVPGIKITNNYSVYGVWTDYPNAYHPIAALEIAGNSPLVRGNVWIGWDTPYLVGSPGVTVDGNYDNSPTRWLADQVPTGFPSPAAPNETNRVAVVPPMPTGLRFGPRS